MLTLSSTVRARRLVLKNVGGFCSRKSVLQLISKRSLIGFNLVDFSPKNSLSFGLQGTNNHIRLFSSADAVELIGENTFGNKEVKYDWNGVMDKTLVDSLRNYNVEEFTTSIGELGKMNVIGSQFSQELLDTIHDVTMAQLQKFDKTQTSIVFHGLGALRIEFSSFSTAEQQDILAVLTRYLPKMSLDEAARLFFGLSHMRVFFGRIPYSFKKATENMLLKQSSETDKSTVIANIVQSLGIMQFKWTNVSVDAKKDSLASNLERHFKNLPSDKFVEAFYGFARWGVKLERVPTGLKNLLMEEGAKHMVQTTNPSDYYILAKIMTSFHLLGVKFRSLSMTAKCNYLTCLQNTLPHLNGNKFIAMLDLLAKSEISFSQLSSKFMEPIRLAVQDGLIRNAEAFMNTEHFSNVFYSIGIMEWQFYSFPPEFKTTLETAMATHIPLMGPRDLMRFLYGVNHMGFQSYAYLPAAWIKLLDESLLKNLPLMTPHEAQSTICSLAFMKAKPRHFDFKTLLALDLAAVTSYDQLFKTPQKMKMLTAMGAIGLDYVKMSKELRDLLHTTIANKNNEEIRADTLQDFIISLKGYDMKAHHFGKKLVKVPQPAPLTNTTNDATIPATGSENSISDQANSIPDVEISTSAKENSTSGAESTVSPKEYLYDRGLALEKLIASHLHNFNEVQTVTVLEALADIGLSTAVFGKDFEQAVAQHIVRLYTDVKTTENVNSDNDTYFNNNSVDNNNSDSNSNNNNINNNSSKMHVKDIAKLNVEEAKKQAIANKYGHDNDGKKYINKMINVLGRLKFDWFMFDPAQRKQLTDVLITTNMGYIHVLSQTLHGFANIDGWYNTFDHAFRDRLLASTANIKFKYNEKNNKINLESANSFSTILSSFGRINTPFFDLPREEIQEVIVNLFGHKGNKLPYTPKDVANVIRALADMDASWNELTPECRAVLSEAVKGMDSYGVADVMHAISVLTFDTPFSEVKALHTDLLKLFERHRITQFTDNNHINKQNVQNCVPYFELLGSTQEGRDLVQEILGYTPNLKAKSEKLPGGIQMAVISRLNRRLKLISPLYSVKTPFPGLKSLLFPLNAAVFYDQNLVAFVDLSEKRFYYDVKNTVDTDVRRVDLFKYHLYDLQYDNIPVHCMKVDQMVEQEKAKPASVSWNFAQLFDAHRHEEQ